MAMSVVPPPTSTSATPSSFSSSVSTDSLAASCSTTVSATVTPAMFTHATMFCVELWLPVTMWTLTSRRAPVMPTGAPIPSCSSTTKSCGSTCRISRPVGSETALAASMARRTSSRVISRFLPATAMTPRLLKPLTCGPDSARWTESISTPAISSASSIAFLIEPTAASRLTTTPRRMPRDSATPMPTRYRSLRPTLPPSRVLSHAGVSPLTPFRPARPGRRLSRTHPRARCWPHVDALVESQVHVVRLRRAFTQCRSQFDVRHLPGDLGPAPDRRNDARRQLRPRGIRRGAVAGRDRQAVDDRQVEIRVLRAILIDDHTALVDEIQVLTQPAHADWLAFGDHHVDCRRQRPPQRGVADPGRRHQPPAPRVEVGPEQAFAAQSVEHRQDLALRQPLIAVNDDSIDLQHAKLGHYRAASGEDQNQDDQHENGHRHRPHERALRFPAARRLDMQAAEPPIRWRGDAAHARTPFSFSRASTSFAGSEPIEPAPSVSTTSPVRARRATIGTMSSTRRATSTGRPESRRMTSASASRVKPS